MNKIYNNLNIDNLMRTEMFNQFDEIQQKKIKIGLEKGLNVSVYAKSTFSSFKMKITRERLENEQKNI